MATIHKLDSHSERLLKSVLTYFVKSSVIRAKVNNITDIDYSNPRNQLSDGDVFIGDDATAFLLQCSKSRHGTLGIFAFSMCLE